MKPTGNNLPAAGLNEVVQAGAAASHLKRYSLIAASLLAAGGGGWFWWSRTQAARDAGPAYVTAILDRGNIDLIITATGTLEPTNEVTVGSELSGITLEVNADINDRVTKGQALARLDTSKLAQLTASSRAAVASAMAKTGQAQATLTESEATLLRQQKLHRISGGRMASPAELDAAIAGAARAKADLLSAQADAGTSEAQLRINENDLEKAVIKAPIDGIILTRSIEPGQTVAASFTAPQLFILAEKLERMILKVAIAEADIGRVAWEQSASFTVDAWPDRTYTAKVFGDPGTGSHPRCQSPDFQSGQQPALPAARSRIRQPHPGWPGAQFHGKGRHGAGGTDRWNRRGHSRAQPIHEHHLPGKCPQHSRLRHPSGLLLHQPMETGRGPFFQ